jgi:hypothetical protein
MGKIPDEIKEAETNSKASCISDFRAALTNGCEWPETLLKAVSEWTVPNETFKGRDYNYFIEGEAFNWLLLAERLCYDNSDLIPQKELEELLFTGNFPKRFDVGRFKELIGVEKYRGYLNYFYGVTVEEALQLAVEEEVRKRQISNGIRYEDDLTDKIYLRIYRKPMLQLLNCFMGEKKYDQTGIIRLSQFTEFKYWLFKYRIRNSDKAKIASDTSKGLAKLRLIRSSNRMPESHVLLIQHHS